MASITVNSIYRYLYQITETDNLTDDMLYDISNRLNGLFKVFLFNKKIPLSEKLREISDDTGNEYYLNKIKDIVEELPDEKIEELCNKTYSYSLRLEGDIDELVYKTALEYFPELQATEEFTPVENIQLKLKFVEN
jgi:hypothetical protein